MRLIIFIEKYKEIIIIYCAFYLMAIFLLNQFWTIQPMAIDNVIYISLFGCFGGFLNYVYLRFVVRIKEKPSHSIYLNCMYTILGIGVSFYQVITRFSLDIPTEMIFVVPGLVLIPNSIIYKASNNLL